MELEQVSLRDYFAAAALTGIVSHYGASDGPKVNTETAYEIADAMLEARGVKDSSPEPSGHILTEADADADIAGTPRPDNPTV